MRSGQVYQPTTTSLPYSQNKSWLPSFFNQNDGHNRLRMILVVLVTFFLILGIIFISKGATDYSNLQQNIEVGSPSSYVIFICLGILFEIVALVLIFIYGRLGYYDPWCAGLFCRDKISKIRKNFQDCRLGKGQFDGQPVSAQYCPPAPPSVESSPPPPFTDISEQQMLMSERDETERILEEDPRIVLTPLKNHEEC